MSKPKNTFTPLIVANWKMQLNTAASVANIKKFRKELRNFRGRVQPVICPSFTALADASKALKGSKTKLGAQNLFWDEKGAYTGEVSPGQLQEQGVEYVIIGHSERRQLLGETDVMVARKMIAAVTHDLMPILCVGENAEERARGVHENVVRRQLESALRSLPPPSQSKRVYIAYEPIWAIGTGEPADPAQAEDIRAVIERTLVDLYSEATVAQGFRILYGGSVTLDNILDYVRPNGYDGVLAGNASLEPAVLAAMIRAVNTLFTTSS